MRRLRHHLVLAGLVIGCLAAASVGGAEPLFDRWSIVSAYLCLGLLCAGLAIGPVRAISTGRPSVNHYLRRDIGIWAALTGLLHLVIGTALSMTPVYLNAFVEITGPPPSPAIRSELFTWGTIAGLVVGVLLIMLLALSNDKTLRLLGPRWWKRLHRTSYLAFALTALHGLAFQVLESRARGLIALVLIASLSLLAIQLTAFRAVRRTLQRSAGSTRSPNSRIDSAGS